MKVVIAEGVIEISVDRKTLEKALGRSEKRINTVMSRIQKRLNKISFKQAAVSVAAFSASVIFSLTKITKSFATFETRLVDMGKVTDEPLEQIKRKILGIDNALGSATAQVEAYYQVISAGVTEPNKAMRVLEISAKAARAAHVAQSEVIKGLTKFMTGFGDSIKDVTEASDKLFGFEKVGQTEFAAIVPLIGSMASIAGTLNVTVDELGGSFGQLTQESGNSAEASTRMIALLRALIRPTKTLAKVTKDLGFETAQAMIAEFGLIDTLRAIVSKTDGSANSIGKLFERSEALLGLLTLMKKDFAGATGRIEDMGTTAGLTERQFARWKETLTGLAETFKAQIGRVILDIVDDLDEEIKDIIKSTGNWVEANQDLIKTNVVSFYETMLDAVTDIASVLGDNPKLLENTVKVSSAALSTFARIVEGWVLIADTIKIINENTSQFFNRGRKFMGFGGGVTRGRVGASGGFPDPSEVDIPFTTPTATFTRRQAGAQGGFTGGLGTRSATAPSLNRGRAFDPLRESTAARTAAQADFGLKLLETSVALDKVNQAHRDLMDQMMARSQQFGDFWGGWLFDMANQADNFGERVLNSFKNMFLRITAQATAAGIFNLFTGGPGGFGAGFKGGFRIPGLAPAPQAAGAGKIAVGGTTVVVAGNDHQTGQRIKQIIDDDARNNFGR